MAWLAGVDGCRGGWVVVLKNTKTRETCCRIVRSFEELLNLPECPSVLGIDMPIGLLDAAEPGGRECDRQARRLLGARRSSVFSPPVRQALRAGSYAQAVRINRAGSPHHIGISLHCFALFPKLAEVDKRMTPALQERTREVHPEVSFYCMNGRRPLPHSKRSEPGQALRRNLLEEAGFGRIVTQARPGRITAPRGAHCIDILDACAACWTAERIHQGKALCIPPVPARDKKDLRMEIWA